MMMELKNLFSRKEPSCYFTDCKKKSEVTDGKFNLCYDHFIQEKDKYDWILVEDSQKTQES